jgi:hypothetical protein
MARMSLSDTGISISGSTDISGQGSKLYFGAGYVGGNWPSEPRYKQAAARDYFTATSPPSSTSGPDTARACDHPNIRAFTRGPDPDKQAVSRLSPRHSTTAGPRA